MFQKRKKFKEEVTPTNRMAERWDQQVFFLRRKFPHCEDGISAIVKAHTASAKDAEFLPTEAALLELEALCTKLTDRL